MTTSSKKSSFFGCCCVRPKKKKKKAKKGVKKRQHRISANFFPVNCPYKSWPKSVNFGQLFETLNPKKLAEIG